VEGASSYETLAAFLSTSSLDGGRKNDGLSHSQRRALKLRMLSRKIEFEQLQTDLEMLTEMLSGNSLKICAVQFVCLN
jgi:hypothetical protein